MESTRIKIADAYAKFDRQAALAEAGNKAAGVRARKISLEIGELLKQYRKESVK
jgi:hypothetical protein